VFNNRCGARHEEARRRKDVGRRIFCLRRREEGRQSTPDGAPPFAKMAKTYTPTPAEPTSTAAVLAASAASTTTTAPGGSAPPAATSTSGGDGNNTGDTTMPSAEQQRRHQRHRQGPPQGGVTTAAAAASNKASAVAAACDVASHQAAAAAMAAAAAGAARPVAAAVRMMTPEQHQQLLLLLSDAQQQQRRQQQQHQQQSRSTATATSSTTCSAAAQLPTPSQPGSNTGLTRASVFVGSAFTPFSTAAKPMPRTGFTGTATYDVPPPVTAPLSIRTDSASLLALQLSEALPPYAGSLLPNSTSGQVGHGNFYDLTDQSNDDDDDDDVGGGGEADGVAGTIHTPTDPNNQLDTRGNGPEEVTVDSIAHGATGFVGTRGRSEHYIVSPSTQRCGCIYREV